MYYLNFLDSKKATFVIILIISLHFHQSVESQNLKFLSSSTLPMTQREYIDMQENVQKENLRQFLLATMKYCNNINYDAIVGDDGLSIYNIPNDSWCLRIFSHPFVNPYEYYLNRIDGDNTIIMNQSNPFKLKQIRASYRDKISFLKKEASKADFNTIAYYSIEGSQLQDYDFEEKKLKLYLVNNFFEGFIGLSKSFDVQVENNVSLPINEAKAEQLYTFFESIKPTKKNGYKSKYYKKRKNLNTKLTYKIISTGKDYSQFEGIPIKVEFFGPKDWNDKLGEIYFN